MRFDKYKMQAFIFLLICMAIYTGWYTHQEGGEDYHKGIIRFHVVANSNSDEDQELKLKVRDGVLEAVNQKLVRETMEKYDSAGIMPAAKETAAGGSEPAASRGVRSVRVSLDEQESREYLNSHMDFIKETAENIIRENGYDYNVTAELGVRWIPEKTYGDMTFPAGNYEALNISIGAAEGNNWWCVLFPPLCLIDGSDSNENADEAGVGAANAGAAAAEQACQGQGASTGQPVGMTDQLMALRKSNKAYVSTNTAIRLKFKTLELLEGRE